MFQERLKSGNNDDASQLVANYDMHSGLYPHKLMTPFIFIQQPMIIIIMRGKKAVLIYLQ